MLPEENIPALTAERKPLPIERAAAGLEVLLCSGFPTQLVIGTVLMTFGLRAQTPDGHLSPAFIFALTLVDSVLVVGLVLFFLRAHREPIRPALFGDRPAGREALFGVALIPVSFFVILVVLVIVQLVAPGLRNVPLNPLADLLRTRTNAVVFAIVAMVAGGVREEVQRGFILRRFERYLGGGVAGLFIFSFAFGLGHLEQGHDVAIATAGLGMLWGAVFLMRRSVLGPMVAHAGFNLAQVLKFVFVG